MLTMAQTGVSTRCIEGTLIMKHYKVKDLMVLNPVVIGPETSLRDAAEKMLFIDCGLMPVGTTDKLMGVVTDRDIAVRAVARGRDADKTKVGDMMTCKVFYVNEDDSLACAVDILKKQRVNRLIVKDSKGRLTGILSLSGLIRETSDTEALTCLVQRLAHNNHRKVA